MSTIQAFETFVVRYPLRDMHFKFFASPSGRPATRDTVLLRLEDNEGHVGWGQSVPSPTWSYETLQTVRSTLDLHLGPALLGMPLEDLAAIHATMHRVIAPSFSIGQPICKAAVDLALVDLLTRHRHLSFAEYLGRRTQDAITLSWTLNPRSLTELDTQLQAAKEAGFARFNLKVGADVEFDLAVCRRLRQVEPDAFAWCDANGGYDAEHARRAARGMADLGIAALEQPVPANRLRWCAELKAFGALPIILDEPIVSRVDVEEFHRLGMLDGVAIKVSRCGGLTEAVAVMEYLEAEGLLLFASGLTDPDVSFAASLALLGAFQLQRPAALNAPQYLEGTFLRTPLRVEGDRAEVPRGPGLGVEIDEPLVRAAQRADGEVDPGATLPPRK